jgi:hypothetical protein
MKEQRKQIRTAAAVEANLGEVEQAQSRFIDAGFVNTGGRNVDWANKFSNATKAGIQAYHATDDYQQQMRDQKTQALASANNYTEDTLLRAKEQEVSSADMPDFLMGEMTNLVSSLREANDGEADDSLSRAYKDTFMSLIQTKYNGLTSQAIATNKGELRKNTAQKMETAIIQDDTITFDDYKINTKTTHTPSEQSAGWTKAVSASITTKADSFKEDFAAYSLVYQEEARNLAADIRYSGMTKKEWLQSKTHEGQESIVTEAELIESRLTKMDVSNPLTAFDLKVKEAITQEGTDGVGVIARLNTTESTALLRGIKTSISKIKGVKYSMIINDSLDRGISDLDSLLTQMPTGSEAEDSKLKAAGIQHMATKSAEWLQQASSSTNPEDKRNAGMLLQQTLLKNPQHQARTIGAIANQFKSSWVNAIDQKDPLAAQQFLQDTSNTLWSTEIGSETRTLLLKAVGPEFELTLNAHRAGVNPDDLIEAARGNRPVPTQEEFKASMGEDNYNTAKVNYTKMMREAAPWAGPGEVESIVKFGMSMDYYNVGSDKATFFDTYAEGMSYKAVSPKTSMEAGEHKLSGNLADNPILGWVSDIWGGHIQIPKSGAWKGLISEDAADKGYAQAALMYAMANVHPDLSKRIRDKLGMTATTKKYGKGVGGEYQVLDAGEGFTDDFQPMKISRSGTNNWKVVMTTQEWTDGIWLIGDDKQTVTVYLDNDDIDEMNLQFKQHLANLSDRDAVEGQDKMAHEKDFAARKKVAADAKTARDSVPIPNIYEGAGFDSDWSVSKWWEGVTEESVINDPKKSTFIPIMPYSK